MARRKKQRVRQKGKISLSRYFQKLETGQKVAIRPEASLPSSAHLRVRGRVGVIEARRGRAYIVRVRVGGQFKRLILRPIHLLKLS